MLAPAGACQGGARDAVRGIDSASWKPDNREREQDGLRAALERMLE